MASMVDCGANGGWLGKDDARITFVNDEHVTVTGCTGVAEERPLVDGIQKVEVRPGEYILLRVYHYAMGDGHTIHSCGQIEHHSATVHDRSRRNGGRQQVLLHDDTVLPLDIVDGLPYLRTSIPTDEEMFGDMYPVYDFTSPLGWDPKVLDNNYPDDAHEELELPPMVPRPMFQGNVNRYGEVGTKIHDTLEDTVNVEDILLRNLVVDAVENDPTVWLMGHDPNVLAEYVDTCLDEHRRKYKEVVPPPNPQDELEPSPWLGNLAAIDGLEMDVGALSMLRSDLFEDAPESPVFDFNAKDVGFDMYVAGCIHEARCNRQQKLYELCNLGMYRGRVPPDLRARKKKPIDVKKLRPYFGYLPDLRIQLTLENTVQLGGLRDSMHF
jgi:hypothetical protein